MNKILKTLGLITIIGIISVSIMACGKESSDDKEVASESPSASEVADIEEAFAESPIMVTSAGQSADFDIAKTLLDKAEITYNENGVLKSGDLGDSKTLIVAVGGSSKGLGAAGIDADDELKRVEEVITQAKANGTKIIALHTGGEGRRGDLSDKFINAVMPHADYMIIVSTGDADGLISGIAMDNGIPMGSVDTIAEVIASLKKAFK